MHLSNPAGCDMASEVVKDRVIGRGFDEEVDSVGEVCQASGNLFAYVKDDGAVSASRRRVSLVRASKDP